MNKQSNPASAGKSTPARVHAGLKTPPTSNVFGKFVQMKVTPTAKLPITAPHQRAEQNGRKEYTPGTIGDKIWHAADALQAHTPNTPVTAEAVRIALPEVNAASVSAGLSHWRKFQGTMAVR